MTAWCIFFFRQTQLLISDKNIYITYVIEYDGQAILANVIRKKNILPYKYDCMNKYF